MEKVYFFCISTSITEWNCHFFPTQEAYSSMQSGVYFISFSLLSSLFFRGLLILLCIYSRNGCGSVEKRYKTFPAIYRMIAYIHNKLLAITNSNHVQPANRFQWPSIMHIGKTQSSEKQWKNQLVDYQMESIPYSLARNAMNTRHTQKMSERKGENVQWDRMKNHSHEIRTDGKKNITNIRSTD